MAADSFDLESAERLLPLLETLLRKAMQLKKQAELLGQEQTRQMERIVVLGGCQVDMERIAQQKKEQDAVASQLREVIEAIEQHGCLIKDLDVGLIDFPCCVGEQAVYLCWKLGEPTIQHWHGLDEGFAGRKPIDANFVGRIRRSSVQ